MCLTICKIQEYSTVNKKCSFKRRKHCFRSPLLSRETDRTSASPEQSAVRGVGRARSPLLMCFTDCASQTCLQEPHTCTGILRRVTGGMWAGGRWRCLVPSVTLVNGGPAWQFTMRLSVTSVVSDSATPWTGAHQAPLSMGFPRQEYWSGLPCPSPGDLPDPGIEPVSLMTLALADMLLTTSATWQAQPWGWCGANIGGEKGMSLD